MIKEDCEFDQDDIIVNEHDKCFFNKAWISSVFFYFDVVDQNEPERGLLSLIDVRRCQLDEQNHD